MQLLFVIKNPVVFQQQLSESKVEQESALLSLPAEVLEHVGRMCPDGSTAIAYTRSCKLLYAMRPKILTTNLPKLQWTLEKLVQVGNQRYLDSFLGHCTTSPLCQASFTVNAPLSMQAMVVTKKMPNVKLKFPPLPFIENFGMPAPIMMVPPRQDFPAIGLFDGLENIQLNQFEQRGGLDPMRNDRVRELFDEVIRRPRIELEPNPQELTPANMVRMQILMQSLQEIADNTNDPNSRIANFIRNLF